MEKKIRPKWELATTIKKADETCALAEKYRIDLEPRLKPDELENLKKDVDLLADRRPAQQENLVNQKAKTKGQDEIASELHDNVVSIRNLVKSSGASDEILKAYGVGEKIHAKVLSVTVGANLVIKAYNQFKEWSNNEAGILEADIKEISDTLALLDTAANMQDAAMIFRKDGTLDKNGLQRKVENEVTHLSAIGAHVFRKKNPALAAQFESLIPSVSETKTEKTNTVK